MKILLQLLLVLLTLTNLQADKNLLDDMAKSEISSHNGKINLYTRIIKAMPQHTTYYNGLINKQNNEIKAIEKELKDNRDALYKKFKKRVEVKIASAKRMITYWKKYNFKGFINLNENALKSHTASLKALEEEHKKFLTKKSQNDKSNFKTKFNDWKKKPTVVKKKEPVKKPKTTIIKKDIKKKPKLKLSTANKSKTSVTSSNVNTTVNIKNVNVSQKAKASVGSVSIGKDKK